MIAQRFIKRATAIIPFILLISASGCNGHSGERAAEVVTDIDGNAYKTVRIGTHTWISENLRVTHYRNGDAIPEIRNAAEWSAIETGAWSTYENNRENGVQYGFLYNWHAVNDPRGLAPKGWHVATDGEWSELAGQKSSGFNALPSGARRDSDGQFVVLGEFARFWTSSTASAGKVFARAMGYYDGALRHGEVGKKNGFSVRCVED